MYRRTRLGEAEAGLIAQGFSLDLAAGRVYSHPDGRRIRLAVCRDCHGNLFVTEWQPVAQIELVESDSAEEAKEHQFSCGGGI